jgi:predicted transcriptional regulator
MSTDNDAARGVDPLVTLTADIVVAHVSKNNVALAEMATLIETVFAALAGLGEAPESVEAPKVPAVSVRASVKPDHIVCLEDGVKLKSLKRHLKSYHQLTPEQYRAKWKLPPDYPIVAPNYAEHRRALAKQFGLGRVSNAIKSKK